MIEKLKLSGEIGWGYNKIEEKINEIIDVVNGVPEKKESGREFANNLRKLKEERIGFNGELLTIPEVIKRMGINTAMVAAAYPEIAKAAKFKVLEEAEILFKIAIIEQLKREVV
jgi:hypothetical protein